MFECVRGPPAKHDGLSLESGLFQRCLHHPLVSRRALLSATISGVYELYEGSVGYPTDALEGIVDEVDKPIVFASGGPEATLDEELAELEELRIPTYRAPERAADAVAALVQYANRNRKPGAALAGEEVSADD